MPYKIIGNIKDGFKVCKKDEPKKCFSKNGLSLGVAKKQERAIILSELKGLGKRGFIGRIGGKTKLVEKILSIFPKDYENMIYVEPFIGGGSILYNKKISKEEIINDLDSNLIIFYKGIQKYNQNKINEGMKDYAHNKKNFDLIKNSNPKNHFDKFIKELILIRGSYRNNMRTYYEKNFNYDFIKQKERLKNVKIYNTDYKKIIKDYDSPNTLFYFDPPYEKSDGLYTHDFLPIKEVYDTIKNIKGKWILSYNDSKEAEELFKDFNINKVNTIYENRPDKKIKKNVKELIITNFKNGNISGSGNRKIFIDYLKNKNINPEIYLKMAKKSALKNGYNPKLISFSYDGKHKLTYDSPEGFKSFGSAAYNDYLIYQILNKIEYANKKRLNYHKRFFKESYDKYSPYELSLNILW